MSGQPDGADADPKGKSITSMPAPSSQMIKKPIISWDADNFLPWDSANPLTWNNASRHADGTRKDGLYERSTKAIDPLVGKGSAPGHGMTESVAMIDSPVPLSWPQDEMLSWNNPQRDINGKRKDDLYEKSSRAMHPPAPGDEAYMMIEHPVPLSWPQDEPLSWNRPERDDTGKRKDGLYESGTNLIEEAVPLSWDQKNMLSWNGDSVERNQDSTRKDGLYEAGTQMIPDSVPLSWDQGKMLSWDADSMFVDDENLEDMSGHVGVEQGDGRA